MRAAVVIAFALLLTSCTGDGNESSETPKLDGGEALDLEDSKVVKLEDAVYGFFLGESKDELFKRTRNLVTWEPVETEDRHYRGELYNISRTLNRTRGVDHVRVTLFDDHLMEVIVYFSDTKIQHLNKLREEFEQRYDARAKAPSGTVETVYKTYRIPAPGMSVTIRRITKQAGTELYVQFIHHQLHRRLVERKKD
jgi:hypothetical protein